MMKIVCSWCRQEGLPGLVGEKPPLDDPEETHGICRRHARALLEALPSASFPRVDLLVLVHPREQRLFDYLERRLAGVRGVKVLLDRRRGERRRRQEPVESERRRSRADRRVRDEVPVPPGYLLVWFGRGRPA